MKKLYKFTSKQLKALWSYKCLNKSTTAMEILLVLAVLGLSITLFFKQEKISRLSNTIKVKDMEIYTKDLCIDILSRGTKAIQSEYETGDFVYR